MKREDMDKLPVLDQMSLQGAFHRLINLEVRRIGLDNYGESADYAVNCHRLRCYLSSTILHLDPSLLDGVGIVKKKTSVYPQSNHLYRIIDAVSTS